MTVEEIIKAISFYFELPETDLLKAIESWKDRQ